MEIKEKLMRNSLISEKLYKLNREEKHDIIQELLENNTTRGLAKELGIPHSTIHDWKSLRQNNTEAGIHVSLLMIYRKISKLDHNNIIDWGRIEMIKDKCVELLNTRGL